MAAMPAEERYSRAAARLRSRYATDAGYRQRKIAQAAAQRAAMSEADRQADRAAHAARARARRARLAAGRAAAAVAARAERRAAEIAADPASAYTWRCRDLVQFGIARFTMPWGCRRCSGPLFWDIRSDWWAVAHMPGCADSWQPGLPYRLCGFCGRMFDVDSRHPNQRYCCRKCATAAYGRARRAS